MSVIWPSKNIFKISCIFEYYWPIPFRKISWLGSTDIYLKNTLKWTLYFISGISVQMIFVPFFINETPKGKICDPNIHLPRKIGFWIEQTVTLVECHYSFYMNTSVALEWIIIIVHSLKVIYIYIWIA